MAEVAWDRDRGVCVGCGLKARFWHHVLSQQKWPELADEPLNVVAVCRRCHERHHTGVLRLSRSSVRVVEQLELTEPQKRFLERSYSG